VFYGGPRVVVTSRYIQNARGRYLVRDFEVIDRVHVFAHPARTVALICGGIELALAAAVAASFGAAVMLCAGFAAAVGLAVAILADGRRNPKWLALRGVIDGRTVTLFSSPNPQEFEQVRRAVIRAVEANRPLRP
jgi:hypothetical protein